MAGLRPYPHYHDTGHDWLGSVPAHWSLLRAKRLFHEVDERSKTGKEELLSVLATSPCVEGSQGVEERIIC
jgi:type I restriction enzyme S subunit